MEYNFLDALHLPEKLDQSEQIFFPTDLKAKYARGKFLFQLALQHYHDAFHTLLQKAFMCFKPAYLILLDNLDKKAQENSPILLLRKCFVQLLVAKKQRVRFVQATIRRHRVALRACFWRLVMWRWQRVQSVKRSVKVSLMIRRTTLRNCLWRWETWRLHRVRSAEADSLQCIQIAKGSARVPFVKLSVPSTSQLKSVHSGPPDSSPYAVVVPGHHVLVRGMDGQTRPVAGLSGDSTLRDLYNASARVLSRQSCSTFGLFCQGHPVRNDPEVLLCTVLTGGGDRLFVQCPHAPGGMLHPYQQSHSSDDDDDNDDEVPSDAESDMQSAAAESDMPSDAPDHIKKQPRSNCWFFEMALVVSEEHIAGGQISRRIVEDVFKARNEYQQKNLSKVKLITFSLQTDLSKSGLGHELIVQGFIHGPRAYERKGTAERWMSGMNVKWIPIRGHHAKDESIQRFLNESVKSPSPSNPDKKLRVDYAGNSDAAKNKGGWNARNAKLSPSAAGAEGP